MQHRIHIPGSAVKPIAIAAMVAVATSAQAVPVAWVGPPDGGFWDVASNWNPGLPTTNSDAALGDSNSTYRSGILNLQSFAGTGQLTLTGGTLAPATASAIGSLLMSGGTLGGAGTVTVANASSWTGGTMAGPGTTSFSGSVTLSGNSRTRSVSGRTLNLNGTTTWTAVNDGGGNPGAIAVSNGATLNNNGTWLDQVSIASAMTSSGTASTFNNVGSYTKTGGGTTDIQVVFNNPATGTVTVNNSVLYLSNGGTLTGTLDAASGATLSLNTGTFAVSGLVAGTGAGQLLAGGGTVNATGTNSFGGTLGVSAGSLNVSGTFNANGYNGSAGALTGTGTVNINGAAVWTGGAMTGAGITNFNNALTLNSNSRTRSVSGRTLNLNGTTTWTAVNDGGGNPGAIAVSNGATLNNNGTWLDQVSIASAMTSSGTASTFNNVGSYTKTGGGTTDIQVVFNNPATGTVTVNNSVLYLSNGGTLTGTLDAASGATLSLNTGTFAVSGLVAGTGAGQLLAGGGTVNATGTNSFGGTLGVSAGSLNVSGTFNANGYNGSAGALTGTGTVNINGAAVWTGGAMTGAGITNFNNALTLNSNSRTRSVSGRTLNLNGTTTWTAVNDGGGNPGAIAVSNGATLNNNGTWLDQVSIASAMTSSGTASTFNNVGSYTKTGGGTTDIQVVFNNPATGTVTVNNSVLYLSNGGTLTGTLDAASGATLSLNTGTFAVSGLVAGTGAGQLLAGGGTVNATGTNSFGGTLGVSAGSLNVSGTFNANGYNGSAGALTGTGTVNINGAAVWTGGAMTGAGITNFNNALTLNSNSRTRSVSGRTLNLNGTTTWTAVNDGGGNPGAIAVSNGATLNNNGTWLDQVSIASAMTSSGTASTFNNVGSYTKTGGGTTDIQVVFNNPATGTVTVNNSVLYLSNGGTLTGTLDAASGATLSLNTGTFAVSGLVAGTGAGQLLAGGGTVNATGTNSFGGTLGVSAGSLNVSGTFNANGYNGSAGALTGTGTVNINGAAVWTGGAMTGAGITNFNNALTLNSNSRTRSVSGRTLNLNGTTTWTAVNDGGGNPGAIAVSNGATLNNNGTWLDQVSIASAMTSSGTASTFNNVGSYTKTGGGTTDIQVVFNNPATGTVTVNNSVLYLSNGGTLTGTLDAASGATLSLNTGTFAVSGLVAGTGAGQLLAGGGTVNATGTNSFGGTLGVSAGSLNVSGTFNANGYNGSAGALTGTGTVNINGAAVWTGGAMTGAGITNFNNALTLNSNSRTRSVSGRTLNLNGTTTWTAVNDGGGNPGAIAVSNGATLNNNGTWLDQVSIASAMTSSGNPSTFNNFGNYVKSGAGTTTDLSAVNYLNTGTTDVQAGTIRLPPTFANPGRLMGNGSLVATTITNNGHVAPGESTGTLTIGGNFIQSAQGFFDVELQSLANHDLLVVSGSAALGGTLNIICAAGCAFAGGQTFTILDAASNALSGTFANVVLTGFAPGSFTVSYDIPNGDVILNAVPEPHVWAMLITGIAVLGFRRRRSLRAN